MSFLFSFFVLPIVFIGMLVTGKNLYLWLRQRESLRAKAGLVTFIFLGIAAGLIAAPHFLTGAFGWFKYVLAGVYVLFIVTGLVSGWKWARLIIVVEDGDPTNDPKFPGEGDHKGCGCPGKKKLEPKTPPSDGEAK